ncbi:hypothetical protein CCR85_03875 [Rhodothalassium salexigens]|uniref:hypothetical protein n=1 Tax=Rhodothalassium salexigens TaxID=1086 RepID=UPI001914402E|nr:hypothetical protein [Rhodothalassium salexigens]MBK5910631.1 hypothetical protein [Rhodothalassium salexigens]MBK5920614.1 hypothetical protein [Rhodothalassium salexigens]
MAPGRYQWRALLTPAHSGAIQDRDGAVPLLKAWRTPFPLVETAVADSAGGAHRVEDATCIAIEMVKKHDDWPAEYEFSVSP